jgi:hypothetical protein
MKLVYVGGQQGGIDFPSLGIVAWLPSEIRDIPKEIADELLARGDFKAAPKVMIEK